MSNITLEEAIKTLYPNEDISEQELKEQADNLVEFFSILIEEAKLQNLLPS